MTRAWGKRFAILSILMWFSSAGEASVPRPVEFPPPDLAVTVGPLPLGLARPPLALPPPPPAAAPPEAAGKVPLPGFRSVLQKPLPAAADRGGFVCAFTALRGGESLVDCGVHRLLRGDFDAAREVLEKSLVREPRGRHAGRAHVWLGEIAFREGRDDVAEGHYRAALALAPPLPLRLHAALGSAWLALRRGDLTESQRLLGPVLTEAPAPSVAAVARFVDGVGRLLAGEPGEALASWEAVDAAASPAALTDELVFWRGVALGRVGQPDRAVRALDEFLAVAPPTHPLHPDAEAQAGWVALERGTPAEAERRFLVAQRMNPSPALGRDLREGLVRVYVALGDPARAMTEAQRLAVDLPPDPRLFGILLLVADDVLTRGAAVEAVEGYRRVLRLSPAASVEAYASYRLAEALEQLGQVGEAADRYGVLGEGGAVEALAQRATYRLGLLALRAGRAAEARRIGEELLRAGVLPELREAALLLAGEGAARARDPNRAAALFRRALVEFPTSPRAPAVRLALGWALLGDNEPESALREWGAATRDAEGEVVAGAQLAIAEVAARQGHDEQAAEALRSFAQLAPSDPRTELVRLNRGVLLVRRRDYGRAVQELEPLIPRLSAPARQALLRRALGIARYHLGQYDAAEGHFRQAAHWAPAEPSSWLGAGMAALAQQRLDEADDALRRAQRAAAPTVAAAAVYASVLATVHREDRQAFTKRATEFVNRYPADPRTGVVLYGLVSAAAERGDPEAAHAWVTRLLGDHAGSPYVGDALLRLAEGARTRPDLAREAYREILARVDDDDLRAGARLGLADTALALGDPAEAVDVLEAFLQEATPSDARTPRALALLVRALETRGQRDAALQATEQFLARFGEDPLAPGIQLTRGHLLLVERRWEPARTALDRALDTGGPAVAAPAHVWLGELERLRGDHEAAIAAYLGATYLYPETPWAARGLQGAAQSYISRQMPREAGILLRKLLAHPAVEPAVAEWARATLVQLGPITEADPADRLRRGGDSR